MSPFRTEYYSCYQHEACMKIMRDIEFVERLNPKEFLTWREDQVGFSPTLKRVAANAFGGEAFYLFTFGFMLIGFFFSFVFGATSAVTIILMSVLFILCMSTIPLIAWLGSWLSGSSRFDELHEDSMYSDVPILKTKKLKAYMTAIPEADETGDCRIVSKVLQRFDSDRNELVKQLEKVGNQHHQKSVLAENAERDESNQKASEIMDKALHEASGSMLPLADRNKDEVQDKITEK